MDTTFLYHRLPCSLQGPLYIIPPRPARACVTHPPSLPILVSHPLLHFLPWHLAATLFLQHHLSRTASRVFFSSKLFPGSKCRILANLKAKNQAKDKKKWFFLSGCPLFKGSTWHPLLMRCQRTLSSHPLDIFHSPSQLLLRCLSHGAFHARSQPAAFVLQSGTGSGRSSEAAG